MDAILFVLFPSAAYRYGKLEELLEKSFPLVKMPSIQPVVMQVLKHLPKASVCRAITDKQQYITTVCVLLTFNQHSWTTDLAY